MLNQIHLVDFNANRQYLLEKTQHMIGGFGKLPGDPPGKYPSLLKNLSVPSCELSIDSSSRTCDYQAYVDLKRTGETLLTHHNADIMHSYLGLAALAAMREPGLKSLDSALCLSISAREQCAR